MAVKTFNGKAIATVKTINGKAIATVKTINAQSVTNISSRYWVGGAAAWDSTAGSKWALTSGGAGGQSVPTATDNVFFDAASGAVAVTKTGAGVCNNLTFTGFTGSFAGSGAITASGSLTLAVGMTRTFTGSLIFNSTTVSNTITLAGKTLASGITFNGVGGAWTLQDTFNTSSSLTVTAGTLNTNGQTTSCSSFTKAAVANVYLGSSILNVSSTWSLNTGAGVFDTGTSTINYFGSNFGAGTSVTYYNVVLPADDVVNLSGTTPTFNNFSRTGSSGTTYSRLLFSTSFTVNGIFTVTGASNGTGRMGIVANTTTGAQLTITAAAVSLVNADFYGVIGAGAATWSGTSIGNAQGNSNITFTSPVTRYLNAGGSLRDFMGNFWATTSGGGVGASAPLPQDTVVIDGNSFTAGGGIDPKNYRLPTLDFTNATNNPQFGSGSTQPIFLGNLIVKSGMTVVGNALWRFEGYGITQTFTTGGVLFNGAPYLNTRNSGTVALGSDCTTVNGFIINRGNFNQGIYNLASPSFDAAGSLVGTFTKSGNITLSATSGTIFTVASTATVNDSGGIIKFNSTAVSALTATTSGKTFYSVENNVTGGFALLLTGNLTCTNNIKLNPSTTTQFSNGSTITFGTLTANGTLGNLANITSTTAHNLVSSSGTAVACTFMGIRNSQASGAAFAATNSTDNGGNTGWIITP